MRLQPAEEGRLQQTPRLSLGMATTEEEMREIQRLRYKVFVEGMDLVALQNESGLDQDEFDQYCDHLLVRDNSTLKIIGSYRVLSPAAARKLGKYYAAQEFDLGRLENLQPVLCEAGRACIHPDYRGGAVLMLLWSGIADYMRRHGCEYLMGCASISLADGGHNAAALYQQFHDNGHMAPVEYQVAPKLPFPLEHITPGQAQVPALLRGYLKGGAWVCGAPAWDPDFHCADFLMLLPLAKMDARFASRYIKP